MKEQRIDWLNESQHHEHLTHSTAISIIVYFLNSFSNIKMSDAFDKLMQSGGSDTSKQTKAKGGRPKHDSWFGYEQVKENGKNAARCLNCSKVLTNTGAGRMFNHR